MIKTFTKAKNDISMISYYIDLLPNRRFNKVVLNRVRMDMNRKVEQLIAECLK